MLCEQTRFAASLKERDFQLRHKRQRYQQRLWSLMYPIDAGFLFSTTSWFVRAGARSRPDQAKVETDPVAPAAGVRPASSVVAGTAIPK
jgi:hypothetical protein